MKIRQLVSLTTMFNFLLLVITGVVLYVVPHGRIADWSDWRWLGLSKTQWGDLHISSGVLFCIMGVWHGCLNGKAILRYLRGRRDCAVSISTELVAALLLTMVLCIGTYQQWPPFSWISEMGERIKDGQSETYGEPPYGRAERSSLIHISKRMGLNLETALASLREANIEFTDENETLGDIARLNDVSPSAVFKIMTQGQPFPRTAMPHRGWRRRESL
jgi:hypothetical protein